MSFLDQEQEKGDTHGSAQTPLGKGRQLMWRLLLRHVHGNGFMHSSLYSPVSFIQRGANGFIKGSCLPDTRAVL